jgi:hypothetical protein
MIKVVMAVLMVLVLASAALAAYPVNHPCLATQSLDPLTGIVTSVDPVKCPASYFGAQDADRRIDPESSGDSGSSGSDGG